MSSVACVLSAWRCGKNVKQPESTSVHFRRMDRRECCLWSAAVAVTLLLTAGLASFLLPGLNLLPSSEDGGGEILGRIIGQNDNKFGYSTA
jgi:hypothetical protein